ncbi:hypothetical protein ACFC1T_03870 [Kitasatospora sp. NPDC056076]|uniref:hypothetical protein n=1 Tax=Kitasatospora sp. NPDC056076 TaxID=3345703 RepID=UPI0035E0E538
MSSERESSREAIPPATERSCPVDVRNDTGKMVDVFVGYRFDEDSYKQFWKIEGMAKEEIRRSVFTARYVTGLGTGHCYWFISLVADGIWYASRSDKQCDLKAVDQDKPVLLSFTLDNLRIGCPESSGCDTPIH